MGRSLSFGSTIWYLIALLGLAFASPSPSTINERLKLAPHSNSPDHYTKGTLSGILRSYERSIALQQLVGL